jgi:hypothetical protein
MASDIRTIGWGLSMVLLALIVVSSAGAEAPATSAGIYVADNGNSRIVRMNDMTGAGWTTFGSKRLVQRAGAHQV